MTWTPLVVPGLNHLWSPNSQGHSKDFLIRLLLCLETRVCRLLILKIRVRHGLLLNLDLGFEGLNHNNDSKKDGMKTFGNTIVT